jgi:hypothetical protein
LAKSIRLALALLTIVLSGLSAAAQIIELRKVGDKTIGCTRSGLQSALKDCGVRSNWYSYVFVGSISATNPADNDETMLQLTPEEIFYGDPSTPLLVITSQGLCLPTLAVGDRWLFYLRKENGKPIVLDYGSDSRPVEKAQQEIETLRQLKTFGDFGLLRGSVRRGNFGQSKVVPGAVVVASSKSDNTQFFATTDSNGHFEFAPLSPGAYKLTVDPIGSLRFDDSSVDMKRGSCWDLAMLKYPHAQISGHVRHSDGSPVSEVPVLIINADGSVLSTLRADANGYFRSNGMIAGKYLVAINSPGAPISFCAGACEIPPTALYYPLMQDRSGALAIELHEDEERNDIDFTIPK